MITVKISVLRKEEKKRYILPSDNYTGTALGLILPSQI